MTLRITDKDLGYKALIARMGDLNGLNVRVGVQSGKVRYPAKQGKAVVAVVAFTHGVHKILGEVYDAQAGALLQRAKDVVAQVHDGSEVTKEMVLGIVGPYQEAIREKIYASPLKVRTGRLVAALSSAGLYWQKWIGGSKKNTITARDMKGIRKGFEAATGQKIRRKKRRRRKA